MFPWSIDTMLLCYEVRISSPVYLSILPKRRRAIIRVYRGFQTRTSFILTSNQCGTSLNLHVHPDS